MNRFFLVLTSALACVTLMGTAAGAKPRVELIELPMTEFQPLGLGIATPAAYVLNGQGALVYAGIGDLVTAHVPQVLTGLAEGKSAETFTPLQAQASRIAEETRLMFPEEGVVPSADKARLRAGLEQLANKTRSTALAAALKGNGKPFLLSVVMANTPGVESDPGANYLAAIDGRFDDIPSMRVTLQPPKE